MRRKSTLGKGKDTSVPTNVTTIVDFLIIDCFEAALTGYSSLSVNQYSLLHICCGTSGTYINSEPLLK